LLTVQVCPTAIDHVSKFSRPLTLLVETAGEGGAGVHATATAAASVLPAHGSTSRTVPASVASIATSLTTPASLEAETSQPPFVRSVLKLAFSWKT